MVLPQVSPGDPHAGAHNAERDELAAHESTLGQHGDKLSQHDTDLANKAAKTHADTHASGGSDPVTPISIGAANLYASSRTAAEENVNLYLDPGTYLFASGALNLPVPNAGYLVVTRRTSTLIMQRFTPSSGSKDGREWLRHSSDGSTWSDWTKLATVEDPPSSHAGSHAEGGSDPVTPSSIGAGSVGTRIFARDFPSEVTREIMKSPSVLQNVDLDTVVEGGYYYDFSGNTNRPPAYAGNGWLEVIQYTTDAYVLQRFTTFSANSATSVKETWYRNRAGGTWGPWSQIGPAVGSGSPEGRYVATKGSVWIDREMNNGAKQWIKTTSVGGSGWAVLSGDTGWRSLTLLNGWVSDSTSANVSPAIRRVGSNVYIRIRNLNGVNATNAVAATIPQGFIPPSADGGPGLFGGNIRSVSVYTNGNIMVPSQPGVAGVGAPMSVTYLVEDTWPAVLPGQPA